MTGVGIIGSADLRLLAAGAVILAALATGGCAPPADDSTRSIRERSSGYRTRAVALESERDFSAALTAFREAARRHPSEPWPWDGIGRCARRLGRHREAREAFRRSVERDSTRLEPRVELAELAWEEERADDALRWAGSVVKLGGETPTRLALLSLALASAGRDGEARHEVARALARAPEDRTLRIARARVLAQTGSPEIARHELDELARAPGDPFVFGARAEVHRLLDNPEEFRSDLVTALHLDPHLPRLRLSLARHLLELGAFEDAESHFRLLLEGNPRDPFALEGIGECALALGDLEAAETAFRESIVVEPESATAHLALGRLLHARGDRVDAVSMLRKARARAATPQIWREATATLAETYLALDEAENALEMAEAILAREPDSSVGRRLRGEALARGGAGGRSGDSLVRIAQRPDASSDEMLVSARWLLERGEHADALDLAERCLARHHVSDARVVQAQALVGLGRIDEAESELHELIRDPSVAARAHLALARLYLDEGRGPDAVFHAREGAALRPEDPDLHEILGRASLDQKNVHDARVAFERAAELRPQSAGAWMNLGRIEMMLDRPDSAAALLRLAHALEPGNWEVSYLLGLAEASAGNPDEAIVAYRRALARNDRVAEAHHELAWLLADRELDPSLAEVHARRAVELQPHNPRALGTLGWAQYKSRMLDEAALTLWNATRLRPPDPMNHYMLGVVQRDRGLEREARAEIEKALEIDPRFERAASAGEILEELGG